VGVDVPPQLCLRGFAIGAINGKIDGSPCRAPHFTDFDQPTRTADNHMPAFSVARAGNQLPAFRDSQIRGGVDRVRISTVAIDERAVGASSPDRQRDQVECAAQIGGFLTRCVDRHRSRSIENPQHGIAARRPPPLDGRGTSAAGGERGREGRPAGLQRLPRLFQMRGVGGQQPCEKLAIAGLFARLVCDHATGPPAKPFEGNGVQHRTPRTRLVELAARPQQGGNRSQRDEEAQRSSGFDHHHSPLPSQVYLRSTDLPITRIVSVNLPHYKSVCRYIHS